MPVMDIMTKVGWRMISDPSGATVGVWQPIDHQGAELFNEPGSLTWNELQSRDLERAKAFYAEVFGWRWVDGQVPDVEYYVGNLDAKSGDDKANCGAMPMPDMVPASAPSMWMVYFAVADCDESVARAQELGGNAFLSADGHGSGAVRRRHRSSRCDGLLWVDAHCSSPRSAVPPSQCRRHTARGAV